MTQNTATQNNTKRVVLITGCSSGIGKATAAAFASAGWITYATARKPETLSDLAARGCKTLALDVTDDTSMTAAVDTVIREQGSITALVNNAGYGEYGALEELPIVEVRRQFETNVIGLIRMCQLVLPHMRAARHGTIINVGSVGGEIALPAGSVYHASKYAVEALSDVLRVEVAPFNVKIALIQPGFIRTNFSNVMMSSQAAAVKPGPYQWVVTALDRASRQFEGNRLISASAEKVGAVILKAASAEHPNTRYKITIPAYVLPFLRRVLRDGGWDAFMRSIFPYKAS